MASRWAVPLIVGFPQARSLAGDSSRIGGYSPGTTDRPSRNYGLPEAFWSDSLVLRIEDVYQWECRYCGTALMRESAKAATDAGRDHLLDTHRSALIRAYTAELTGSECRGGCGYRFPRNPNAIDSGVCPTCGTDALSYYAGRNIWTDVEKQ